MNVTEDPYERQLMEFDIEEFQLDLNKFCLSLHQYDNEMNAFMEWINKKNWGSIEEVEKAAEYTEEDERKYWIARMGKQAAIDVYTTEDRTGNLDSIAMMREDDQYATLNVAMQYSGLLSGVLVKYKTN